MLICFNLTCIKPGFNFNMVVTVRRIKIESRSFSATEIQQFRTENRQSGYN